MTIKFYPGKTICSIAVPSEFLTNQHKIKPLIDDFLNSMTFKEYMPNSRVMYFAFAYRIDCPMIADYFAKQITKLFENRKDIFKECAGESRYKQGFGKIHICAVRNKIGYKNYT